MNDQVVLQCRTRGFQRGRADKTRRKIIPCFYTPNMKMLESSVDDETKRIYEKQVAKMTELGFEISFEGLVDLARSKDGVKAESLLVTRSAVNWKRRCQGLEQTTPGQNRYFNTLLRGRRVLMGGCKRRKGAIDWELLGQLIEFMRGQPGVTPEERRNVKIAWATGLRSNQVTGLRRFNFIRRNGAWALAIEENHKPNRLDRDMPTVQIQFTEPRLQPLLDSYLPELTDDALVCPGWKPLVINRLIKAAAAFYNWDTNVDWRGVHQLRHGVATEVLATYGLTVARALLGHTQPKAQSALAHEYRMPNAERAQRNIRHEQRKKGKAE